MSHAEHFATREQQAHAARLGMWVFIGSEVIFFSGLFVLYAAERASDGAGFADGVRHADKMLGSVNTFILLVSSAVLALGVHLQRLRHPRLAAAAALCTALFGLAFLVVKGLEYADHVHHGVLPGASSSEHGPASFWTLYYVATGFHAAHVAAGCGALFVFAGMLAFSDRAQARTSAFENVALFWHYVDVVWIFLWPLFYLAGGGA